MCDLYRNRHRGKKGCVGYVGQNKSTKFWLSILEWNKKRDVKDILIACADGATGFLQAIEGAIYPRHTSGSASSIIFTIQQNMYFTKELKSLIVVLKNVYVAPIERKLHYPMTAFRQCYIWQ